MILGWHRKALEMNVALFMDKLFEWQCAGFLSDEVWSNMKSYVNPELLPVATTAASSSGSHATISAAPSGGNESELPDKRKEYYH